MAWQSPSARIATGYGIARLWHYFTTGDPTEDSFPMFLEAPWPVHGAKVVAVRNHTDPAAINQVGAVLDFKPGGLRNGIELRSISGLEPNTYYEIWLEVQGRGIEEP